MKNYEVIIRPHVTEKTNNEIADGKYAFVVAKNATKTDVAKAVESLFGVKVLAVNTVNYDGKAKARSMGGRYCEGTTPSYKKAIVKIDTDPSDKKYKNSIEEFGISQ